MSLFNNKYIKVKKSMLDDELLTLLNNGGNSVYSKGIEVRNSDPTGADLYEGRMWIISATGQTDTTAPTVTNSLAAGTYTSAQSVILTANETATIYYTMDESTPTTSSSVYSSPISIANTTTLKFFAKDTAGNQSSVQSVTYTINLPDTTAPVVTASPSAGIYTVAQSVTLSANESATIYYTLDSSDPTISATKQTYSAPISISATTTLKFYGVDTAGNPSAVQTVNYTINIDTTAPNEVTNLAASNVGRTILTLSWTASTNSDIASYNVYQGATLLGNTVGTTYNVTGLTANTGYTFTVKAKDASGNVSTGTSVSVTTTGIVYAFNHASVLKMGDNVTPNPMSIGYLSYLIGTDYTPVANESISTFEAYLARKVYSTTYPSSVLGNVKLSIVKDNGSGAPNWSTGVVATTLLPLWTTNVYSDVSGDGSGKPAESYYEWKTFNLSSLVALTAGQRYWFVLEMVNSGNTANINNAWVMAGVDNTTVGNTRGIATDTNKSTWSYATAVDQSMTSRAIKA